MIFLAIDIWLQPLLFPAVYTTLGFYVLLMLFLATAPMTKFGVTSLGYDFGKSLLKAISPFIWLLIILVFLSALTHGIDGTHGMRTGLKRYL
jgi:hypothetical protein